METLGQTILTRAEALEVPQPIQTHSLRTFRVVVDIVKQPDVV